MNSAWAYEEKSGDPESLNLKSTTTFDNICGELLGYIGEFLINPVANLGSLNRRSREPFKGDCCSLKYYYNQRFNIPELADVTKCEPELATILNLTWCRNNNYILFVHLLGYVSSEQMKFKTLFRPLVLYLNRTFKELTFGQRARINTHLGREISAPLDTHLGKICAKNGNYDLAIDFLASDPKELISCLSEIKSRQSLFMFFQSNPHYGKQYLKIISNDDVMVNFDYNQIYLFNNVFKWIFECVVFDASQEFYLDLLISKPLLLKSSIESGCFLYKVPESEFPRIHYKMRELISTFLEPCTCRCDYDFYNLINSIRFGSITSNQLNLKSYNNSQLVYIAKVALLGNKQDLFLSIYYKYNSYNLSSTIYNMLKGRRYKIMDEVIKMLYMDSSFLQANNLKLIFELLAAVNSEVFDSNYYLYFIMKYYAIKNLKVMRGRVFFEFVALENLLSLEFPPKIVARIEYDNNVSWFVNNILSYMKVVDEETVTSLLSDLNNFRGFKKSCAASFELLELISKSSRLTELLKRFRMRLCLDPDDGNFAKYLDLPFVSSSNTVHDHFYIFFRDLIELRTKKHFETIERIRSRSVANLFLEYEASNLSKGIELNEFDYMEWRLAFAYWIKGHQKHQIQEIRSRTIIHLLKLEFQLEMSTLFK